jgi:acetyltransferase-like isoleucine patch superfamily enzyme
MSAISAARQWAKASEAPAARLVRQLAGPVRDASLPPIPGLHRALYATHRILTGGLKDLVRRLYWTPLFQSRLETPAPGLFLYGGLPLILGKLRIELGEDCRISGQTTLTGRVSSADPVLEVGSNVDIGWQTTIAVGTTVTIGNNVRIAGRAFLAGYPGHPLDPADRAAGLPDREHQVGAITLEDDVWLATGVTVLAGVTIGRGTIVAAGSVVTRDLPAMVLAGGVPARAIRAIEPGETVR